MNLEGRVGVITGATGEVGRAAAQALAGEGARLVLVGTSSERLGQLSADLKLAPEQVLLHTANLREPDAARGLAQAVSDRFGRVDVLLNLVGGYVGGKTVVEFAAGQVDEMLQQHLWTTWYLAQAFVPLLTANGWGRIIVISSPAATNPSKKSAPYAVAKAAQDTLMLTLAQELRGTNVSANILQVRTIDARHERDRERTPENSSWTTPEEIAAAILYLCSEPAQVISGVRIPLFGAL